MAKADSPKEISRGTSDELEIMRDIILADKYLFDKVVNRIRQTKNSVKAGLIDEMSSRPIAAQERDRITKKTK